MFVAGILVGDLRAPYKAEIERFHSSLASLAEIIAFAMLGLTVSLTGLVEGNAWWVGLVLAVLLALVVRPVLVGLLLLPIKISKGERLFVMWSGLKGAVPILLGTYILSAGVPNADRLYQIVIVAVAFSVVVQGGLVPTVAHHTGVPMRVLEPEPWALGMRMVPWWIQQPRPRPTLTTDIHRHRFGIDCELDKTDVRAAGNVRPVEFTASSAGSGLADGPDGDGDVEGGPGSVRGDRGQIQSGGQRQAASIAQRQPRRAGARPQARGGDRVGFGEWFHPDPEGAHVGAGLVAQPRQHRRGVQHDRHG